jgi:hypothetical protein
MSIESIVYEREVPYSLIPDDTGTGSGLPVQIVVTAVGTHLWSGFGIPADADVIVTLWGGGGGGGAANDTPAAGGGGGAGALALISIPAAIQAAGGSLVIGARGLGGVAENDSGANALASTLTLDSILRLTCGGGEGASSTDQTGGNGGTVSVGAGVTTLASHTGQSGGDGTSTVGGAGGSTGVGTAGNGGAGGVPSAIPGGNGQNGKAIIQYSL